MGEDETAISHQGERSWNDANNMPCSDRKQETMPTATISLDSAPPDPIVRCFSSKRFLRKNPGERLSEALREVYALSPAERARRFYSHRFGSSKDNVAAAFSYFAENGEADLMNSALKELIKHFFTSGNLPTREEAIVCGEVLASRLDAGLAW